MTRKEVIKILKINKLKIKDFDKWMNGQTVGLDNGEIDYYEQDVGRFIRGRGKLKTLD
jgi:hypothetical protein